MCIRDSLKRDLSILSWNANGLSNKIQELQELLARLKPDIVLLNETHLTPASRLRLANYVCYRNDRPGTASGGTAVAVRLNLEHHRVVLPATTHLEGTAVEMLNTCLLYTSRCV